MKKFFISFLFLFIGVFNLNAQTIDSIFQDNYSKFLKYNHGWYNIAIENMDREDEGLWLYSYDSIRALLHVDKDLNVLHYASSDDGSSLSRRFKLNNKIYSTRTNPFDGSIPYSEYYYRYMDLVCSDLSGNILFSQRIKNEDDDSIEWLNSDAVMFDNSDIIIALWGDNSDWLDEKPVRLIKVDTSGNVLADNTFWKIVHDMDMMPLNEDQLLYSTSRVYEPINNKIYFVNSNTLEIEDSITGRFGNNMKKINDSIVAFNGTEGRLYQQDYVEFVRYHTYIYLLNTRTKYSYSIEEMSNPYLDSIFYKDGSFSNPIKNNFDFINPDSIFSYFSMYKEWYDMDNQYLGNGIINFNSQGSINYFYIIPISFAPLALKATNDGGLIITCRGNYLYKFMPNGFNSILNLETMEKEKIRVYPNPAKDYIIVDFDTKNFEKGEIELFDMQGKVVKKTTLKTQKGNRVDVSSLKAGSYIYNVSLNGNTIGGMIVVVK